MQLDEKEILGEKKQRRKAGDTPPPNLLKRGQRGVSAKTAVINPSTENETAPQSQLPNLLNTAFDWIVYGMVFLIPLAFVPFGTASLELAKQSLLLVGTFAMVICYGLAGILSGTFPRKSSPIFIGIAVWLATWLGASIFSFYPYNSFIGIEKQEVVSFATAASCALLAFLIGQRFTATHVTRALFGLYGSLAAITAFGILQLLGIFLLPFPFARNASFNLAAPFDISGILAALLVAMPLIHIIALSFRKSRARKESWIGLAAPLLAAASALGLIALILLNDWRLWLAVAGSLFLALVVLFIRLPKDKTIGWLLVPTFVLVFSSTVAFFKPQIVQLPLIAQPTWMTSASIAAQTIRAYPFFGTGPGNFLSAYTEFRPQEINKANYLQLWAARFDQSSSYLLTLVAAGGVIGFLGILAFVAFLLIALFRGFFTQQLTESGALLLVCATAISALGIAFLLKPGAMAPSAIAAFLVGCAAALTARTHTALHHDHSNRFVMLSSLILFLGISLSAIGGFFLVKRALADVAFAEALQIDNRLGQANPTELSETDIDRLVAALMRASALNPSHATYPRLLSQALNYRLSNILSSKDPSQPEVLQQLQALAAQSVEAAKRAVALAPRDVRNIENLAAIYQAIAPMVSGADEFAVKQYEEAARRDPANPAHQLNLGKFHLAQAILNQQRAAAQKEGAEKAQFEQLAAMALEKAESPLQKALELKNDYALAHYSLALLRLQQKKNNEALSLFDTAFNTNIALANQGSVDLSLFINLGVAFQSLDEMEKAESAFRLALNIQPDAQGTLWQYALFLTDKGDITAALAVLERLAQLDPESRLVKEKIAELKKTSAEPTEKKNATPDKKEKEVLSDTQPEEDQTAQEEEGEENQGDNQ